MLESRLPTQYSSDPIRQFDLTRDLDPVADLIELCFPTHADPDGQSYVREMRKTAREIRMFDRLAGLSSQYPGRSPGFVWEENGQVIGNLSLVPMMKDGRRINLLANVAVHPQHRRRGIANKLTQHALKALHQRNEREVWLQVRDDNPPAIQLYRSFGFTEQAIRTTWRMRPDERNSLPKSPTTHCLAGRWLKRDWAAQRAWLDAAYPANLHWNLPLKIERFSTDLLQLTSNILEGTPIKHWSVKVDGKFQGVITWQRSNTYANNLWLAFPIENEAEVLPVCLSQVLRQLPQRHPLSIDYPRDRCAEQLARVGFKEFRTLIWMAYWL
ncbi:MAG: GNAT family N-acetyltransferase [Chloroflexi bacterium]|nr:GNAT family N-acetyltransferase [Chloroflexota bacterium]